MYKFQLFSLILIAFNFIHKSGIKLTESREEKYPQILLVWRKREYIFSAPFLDNTRSEIDRSFLFEQNFSTWLDSCSSFSS